MTKLQNIEQKSKIYKNKINILKGILGENVVDELEYLMTVPDKNGISYRVKIKPFSSTKGRDLTDFRLPKNGLIEINGKWYDCLLKHINTSKEYNVPVVKISEYKDVVMDILGIQDKRDIYMKLTSNWKGLYLKLLAKAKEDEKKKAEEFKQNNDLLEILKKETASLKKQYIELTEEWAKNEFEDLRQWVRDYRAGKFGWGKASKKYYRLPRYITDSSGNSQEHIDKMVKLAELHYEDSIIKLAHRIEQKGLDKGKLKVQTAHVGVNIETVLTDGKKTVKAWTIIAGGAVQKPHYRYLVK